MKIIKNYFYNVGYQVLALILPLITTPYVSRVLGPDGVGINAYTNSIVQYFILLASLGISLYGNREIAYVRDNEEKLAITFWEIQSLKLITTTVSLIVFLILHYLYFLLYTSDKYISCVIWYIMVIYGNWRLCENCYQKYIS